MKRIIPIVGLGLGAGTSAATPWSSSPRWSSPRSD